MTRNLFRSQTRAILSFITLISLSSSLCLPARACDCKQYDKAAERPDDVGNKVGLAYSKTGAYRKEFDQAIKSAYKACRDYKREHPEERNLAIVSDLDETLIDNRGVLETTDDWSWPAFLNWIKTEDAPTLKKTERFLRWARKNGFAVFFITGRKEDLRAPTVRNLVARGIPYDGLYMRPTAEHKQSAIVIKKKIRKQIEEQGFTIVVNIGDQVSDLVGGHSVDCEKLPNKLYFVE